MTSPFIPFANPHAAYGQRKQEILDCVARVFDAGQYSLGHTIACANGTDAIELALRALGVGPGKAVFTVSHTAVATVAAIERAGGLPVLVDIDAATYTMSPISLDEAIVYLQKYRPDVTPAVVIPVHLYGHPCDMDAVSTIATRHGLAVLEDCAQAHGACYKGCKVGTMGAAASFSFYPTKNLGALGDGGAVATNSATLAEEMAALRQYGWKARYIISMPRTPGWIPPTRPKTAYSIPAITAMSSIGAGCSAPSVMAPAPRCGRT